MTAEKTRTLPLPPILNTNFPRGRHCVAGLGKKEGLTRFLQHNPANGNRSIVKPKSKRRITMKSSTQDNAEGKMHKVKGKIKEIAGKVSINPDLEAEGKEEGKTGKVQEKIGEIKKVVGK